MHAGEMEREGWRMGGGDSEDAIKPRKWKNKREI
jgi:hypothetical protein